MLVVLKQTSSATMGQDVYLRLTALEDTRLYEAMAVETSQNKTSISGFEVAPELYVQVGAGVGIEILKAEIYIKVSIGCAMSFANPTGNGTREDFRLMTFDFGAALGINVQLLMFSYELELIGIYINYDYEGNPRWTYTWSALNGAYGGEGDLKTLSEDGGSTGVKVSLPGSSADTQTIYSTTAGSDLEPLAIDPNDKEVPSSSPATTARVTPSSWPTAWSPGMTTRWSPWVRTTTCSTPSAAPMPIIPWTTPCWCSPASS